MTKRSKTTYGKLISKGDMALDTYKSDNIGITDIHYPADKRLVC